MTDLQTSLSKCKIDGNILYLPPISEGMLSNYADVKNALMKAGAKYKRNTFVFPNEAQPYIDKLMNGDKVNLQKEFQFFATPQTLAAEMVRMADISSPDLMVLEPSAGQGAIVKELLKKEPGLIVHCFELMDINRSILEKIQDCVILGNDFINDQKWLGQFDRIVANPPFAKNQDIDHIRLMYVTLRKGGRIVTLASKHWQNSSNKKETDFKKWLNEIGAVWEDVPTGTFKESGTNIACCLITIDK